MLDQLTICAIATSTEIGAIATIRLSGEKVLEIADSVFQSPNSGKKTGGTTTKFPTFWQHYRWK